MNKQVTLDIYHRPEETIENGDVVSTTTSEFAYNGVSGVFDNEATECTTVVAEHIGYNYDEFNLDKCRNGGCYGFDYFKVIDNDPTVEFTVFCGDTAVSGYLPINEADDEAPLRFYDNNNQEQWNIPSNPYRSLSEDEFHLEEDYDFLVETFQETDIIQLLVDNAEKKDKEVYLDEDNTVLLIIN